jgi:signal transduction histidine kinase
LIWTFIERDETFLFTGGALFASFAMLLWNAFSLGLILLGVAFLPEQNAWMVLIWDLVGIALAALGCILLRVRRPHAWGVGTAILLFLGVGHSLELLLANTFPIRPGAVRLAQILALPWALVLLQRVRSPKSKEGLARGKTQRVDTKPLLVDELLKISQLENVEGKHQTLARALSLSLIADMCCLVELDGSKKDIRLLAGYDLIREHTLPTPRLSWEDLPNILESWGSLQPYAPDRPVFATRDADTLTDIINYHKIGHILAYPLGSPTLKGGVIFLSPYTEKQLAESGLKFMGQIGRSLAEVLFEPDPITKLTTALDESRNKADQNQQKAQALSESLTDAQSVITHQEEQIKQLKAKYQIDKLKMIKEIDACQEKIIQLSSQAASHKRDRAKQEELQANIHELTAEKQRLADDLVQAKARITTLESRQTPTAAPQGPPQIEILSLAALAANVRLAFGPRCQQHDVSLDIANPNEGSLIKTDPIQLQTLITNLLENGLLASKPEGSLHFRMELFFETGMLQIQVTDSGGGLSPEEQHALFGEMEETPSGIGSLQAIREAVRMVQALNGKVWLRSQPGELSTFRVQLPVRILD